MRVDLQAETVDQGQETCCRPDNAKTAPGEESAVLPVGQARSRRWTLALILGFGVIVAAYVLLWSPWWYPLSDSSLYISVARNMDEGRGYTYMGRPHRMVTPLTPAMLWGLMQFSRSFGLMNASMIACMLGSFVFMYLTLKEWMDRRAALGLTVVSALTYWQFRMATIIMSEQAFLLLFWMGLYFLVLGRRQPERRTLWLGLAAGSLFVGAGFRIAGLLMIPVIAPALWLEYAGRLSVWRRTALVGGVILPMLLVGGAYGVWQIRKPQRPPREHVAAPRPAPTAQDVAPQVREITGYRPRLRILASPAYQWPAIMGRWLAESVVAPSRDVFLKAGKVWGHVLGTVIVLIAMIGLWRQVQARNWWLTLPILYVLAFVVFWGTRYIPRYLAPVAPIVLLWFSTGLGEILDKAAGWLRAGRLAGGLRRAGMIGVPVIVLLCNLPILAAEIYVCRQGDFYGSVRQGAASGLVDAAGYVRKNLSKKTVVCTNDRNRRREAHLLTGRPVAVYDDVKIRKPTDLEAIREFFLRTGARCAVIHYESAKYPEWHFDPKGGRRRTWWGLYVWHEKKQKPVRIKLPKDRKWILQVPDSRI